MQFQLNALFKTINECFWPQPRNRLGDFKCRDATKTEDIPDQVDSDQVFHVRQQWLGGLGHTNPMSP